MGAINFPLPQGVPEGRTLPTMNLAVPSPASTLARVLDGVSKEFEAIAAEREKTQATIDFAQMQGLYQEGVAALEQEARQLPSFEARQKFFNEGLAKLSRDVGKQGNKLAASKFAAYSALENKQAQIKFAKDNFGIANDEAIAQADESERLFINRFALTDDPDDRFKLAAAYQEQLSALTSGPVPAMNVQTAAERYRRFEQKALKARGEYLISRSPMGALIEFDENPMFKGLLITDLLDLKEKAIKAQTQIENNSDKVAKKVQEIVMRNLEIRANQGLLTDAELDGLLKGQSAYVTPEEARRLASINSAPPTTEANAGIQMIMQTYYSGAPTQARIERARRELRQLARGLDRPSKALSQAYRVLQNDEQELESINAQRANRAVKEAMDIYEAENPSLIKNPISQRREAQDKARIARDVRQGVDPKTAVQKRLNERKAARDAMSEQEKFLTGDK